MTNFFTGLFGGDTDIDRPEPYVPSAPPDMSQYYDLEIENQNFLNSIAESQLGLASEQNEIAEERYNQWKNNLSPVELEYLRKTKSGINPKIYVSRIRNAFMQEASPALRNQQKADAAKGVDSSSVKSVSRQSGLSAGIANAMGNATQGEKERIENLNRSKKTQVVGLGRNIPGLVSQGLSSVSSQMSSSGNIANTSNQQLAGALKSNALDNYSLQQGRNRLDYENRVNKYSYDVQRSNAEAQANQQAASTVATVAVVAWAL